MQLNNLNIVPNWRLGDAQGRQLHASLLPLLAAIDANGKITQAAKAVELSYRHAWNILQEAEEFFGLPLVSKERGRGAVLSDLGRVLLQANQRVDARLHTQMESLAMELNAEVQKVLSDQAKVMRIYASHGYAVALIPKHLKDYQTELHYHGSEDALQALHAGSCKIAGFTLPMHHNVPNQQQRYQDLVFRDDVGVVGFIKRQQGLMYQSNSEQIASLNDIAEKKLRIINRQPRSGTRELFDHLLEADQIQTANIRGYDQYEYTHTAVAAQVATGMADIGFGIEAAAARFDLNFTTLTEDVYLWAYKKEHQHDPEVQSFIDMLKSQHFQTDVNNLPGYACDRCGEEIEGLDQN